VDGEVVDEFLGALPEAHVRRWLAGALPSPRAAAVAEARARLERREFAAAAEGLRGVLAVEPGNAEARVLLAEALLHTDPGAVAGALAELDQDSEDGDRAAALRALARVAELAGRPDELPAAPVRERFLEGAAAVRAGDWAAALAAFIDVLRAQRDYAGGLAKEAARAIFVLLGIRHPICERFHRAFSSAVNV
jgi:putative thioredoxin